ncbi:MAG: phasin family protein [Beijerinckiaceae bacterium]
MSASKSAGTSGQSPSDISSVESITRSMQGGLAQAMEIPKKVMEANLDTGSELLTFMSRRMKAQADLFSGVGHCHDMTEAADMQRNFWAKVTKDYTEEMNHLSEIARKNFETMSALMSPKSGSGGHQGRAM